MSDQEAQQEPTMEEILASIRRIISEEDEGGDEAAPAVETAPEDSSDEMPEQAEVLELTQKVDEDGVLVDESEEQEASEPAEPEPEPEPESEPELQEEAEPAPAPVLDSDDDTDDIVAVEPVSTPMPDETLLGNVAAGAAAASFGNLARNVAIASSGSRTLEDMVLELLKPILKSWLDENLPSMVEEMVREEITRVAKLGRTSH